MTHRTRLDDKQITRLEELHADPDAWLGYWCSDQWGRSANGGDTNERWHAYPGAVHEIDDGLELAACPARGEGGLHATLHPHQWRGCRVWMVALLGERVGGESKCAARKREIICEMRPGDLLTPQIAVRLGVNLGYLQGVNFQGTDLRGSNLQGADLCWVSLRDSNLRGSNLQGADLRWANLREANLRNTSFWRSSLQNTDLRNTDLRGSDLELADLRGADLRGTDLRGTNLEGTILPNNYEDVAITSRHEETQ